MTDEKFDVLTSLNKEECDFLLSIFDRLVPDRVKYYMLKGMGIQGRSTAVFQDKLISLGQNQSDVNIKRKDVLVTLPA